MKVLQVVEQQMIADKGLAMFEINRLLSQPDPPEDVTARLVDAVEQYSSASLSLEIVQKLIDAHSNTEAKGNDGEN